MSDDVEPDAGDQATEIADQPAEDGDTPSVARSHDKLLDRLLYKGVLPRYAFPTDVVSFHVFDRDNSSWLRREYLYAPSQGLSVALTQYAPGKVVWIDGREWKSGAIYSDFDGELRQAWDDKRIYFECAICHFAEHVSLDDARRGDIKNCRACESEDSCGPAMYWMRPPGFAHRVNVEPGTSPDDAPARSYATRAKLVAEGPSAASDWTQIALGLKQTYQPSAKLLVTNTGPRNEGYSYCTSCGLIEPNAVPTGIVTSPHQKPYPDQRDPECSGTYSTRELVLGTDFESDVLLVRLSVGSRMSLSPELESTQVALRTIAEALIIAATDKLEIESSEIQAEFRPALTQSNGREAEIFLYDTLAGGAGFTHRVSKFGDEIFKATLYRLENCPAQCDQSCYQCLRSFRNRFDHALLDRHVGASLLRYLLDGTPPVLDEVRRDQSADQLSADLISRNIEGTIERNVLVDIAGIGEVDAPILITRGSRQWIFAVHAPMAPDVAPTESLQRAKDNQLTVPVCLIDDLVIARNLPKASLQAQQRLT